ncbi:hypothetical protein AWB64_06213 [Caballeronia sordidicola]|uniref:Uncharacterized protein n=1 Tax=Caballeronia sordidicola TaxID=196367 RepID=A0A158IIN4_CABSO|nr:hypothetical protein AWB64_06213 [Caballeronia sordidicola]
MGKVDFRSDRSKPTRATFERDYPSTSQEWNEYEARHRQDMSSFPVKPGETFAEDGFYRYVIHSQRSRFVFSGRKGEVARSYTNIVNEKGEPMDGSPHWIWEADRAVEDHCSVNDPCPRDGRWTWASNYSFRDYMGNNNRFFERRFVAGELMPELELNGTLSHYLWTWIGV